RSSAAIATWILSECRWTIFPADLRHRARRSLIRSDRHDENRKVSAESQLHAPGSGDHGLSGVDSAAPQHDTDPLKACLASPKSFLDRFITGSGSDRVSDQRFIDSHGLTRSLPLPVLTRSKNESYS